MKPAPAVALLALAPLASAEPALTTDEVRAIVREALADAETRTSLSGATAGYEGGFFIASEDNAFRLSVGGLLQFRYQFNHRDDAEDEANFFTPRARLWFKGTIHETIGFFIRGQFSGTETVGFAEERVIRGVYNLDRAWVDTPIAEGWSLRFGQQASDFSRESELAPQDQLGVNSSPTDAVFSLGGYQGVRLHHRADDYRLFFTFSDGARNTNSEFGSPRDADFALTFKADWKLAGEWSRFSDFTSRPGSDTAVMLGAGVHWENGAEVGDPTENLALFAAIAEVTVEGDGWSVFGSFNWFRNTIDSPDNQDLDDFGVVVQGSFYLTETVEPYLRFDAVFADSHRDGRNEEFRTVTAGLNWYLVAGSNLAKFSVDAMYMLDSQADSLVSPSANTGVLASSEPDQITARAQFTLVF